MIQEIDEKCNTDSCSRNDFIKNAIFKALKYEKKTTPEAKITGISYDDGKTWINLQQISLQRLGFVSERKSPGISYYVTRNVVNEVKERMDMDNEEEKIENKQQERPKSNSLDEFKEV